MKIHAIPDSHAEQVKNPAEGEICIPGAKNIDNNL